MIDELAKNGRLGKNSREEWSVAWLSSCSRNAHDRNVLVRRAQSRINQATLPQRDLASRPEGEEKRANLEGAFIFGERRSHGPLLPERAP